MKHSLQNLYAVLRETLSESDAHYVLRKRTGLSAADLVSKPNTPLSAEQVTAVKTDMKRHMAGEPLSRIYGEREFYGLNFALSPDTLDPRQDTETLIDAVLAHFKNKPPPEMILDLGTGSGCILIALLNEYPQARGIGADRAFSALKTARKNAEKNGVAGRAGWVCGHWAQALTGPYDLVVSNPPYIETGAIANLDQNVRDFDPIPALDGGKDGMLAYRDIFSDLPRLLKKSGSAFFEIGFDQEKTIMRLSGESGFSLRHVHRDSAGRPRVAEIYCA